MSPDSRTPPAAAVPPAPAAPAVMEVPHLTAAWPLSLIYTALIVYASLYPFGEWRDQGVSPFIFLTAPLPKYWSGFDVIANVLGYAPLGFLFALAALRTGRGRGALVAAFVAPALLSLAMETLQSYLPTRVPSNVDLGLNAFGAWLGATTAWTLEQLGALDRWGRFRSRWFVPQSRGALVLLATWPLALLFPAAVPLGLGQVMERLEAGLASLLEDTPFLEWLPVRDIELQPLVPAAELLCVVFGLLAPCLLAYSVIRSKRRRAAVTAGILLVGLLATALSSALSYGPEHAWAWLRPPVQVGLLLATALAGGLIWLTTRACAAVGLLVLGVSLSVLNQAPNSAYFWQTLQTWEQGRFIRFHGLAQWLGWIWPYAVVAYLLGRLSRREVQRLG